MVIATKDRIKVLARTIEGFTSDHLATPVEIILVDASSDVSNSKKLLRSLPKEIRSKLIIPKASEVGAASQRNIALPYVMTDYVFFADDDIIPEEGCLSELYQCISQDKKIGGVNALITNQSYVPLGKFSKKLCRWYLGKPLPESLAGRCIGPAKNFLPCATKTEPNEVDWLNTTCTIYRKEALPNPVFDDIFVGASVGEDLALSLRVGKNWKLFNAPSAKVFHDSQPGSHKRDVSKYSEMTIKNRDYISRNILSNGNRQILPLLVDHLFEVLGTVRHQGGLRDFPSRILGLIRGLRYIVRN